MCTTLRTTYQRGSLSHGARPIGSSCARTAIASATSWRVIRVWLSDSVSVSQSSAAGPNSCVRAMNSDTDAGPCWSSFSTVRVMLTGCSTSCVNVSSDHSPVFASRRSLSASRASAHAPAASAARSTRGGSAPARAVAGGTRPSASYSVVNRSSSCPAMESSSANVASTSSVSSPSAQSSERSPPGGTSVAGRLPSAVAPESPSAVGHGRSAPSSGVPGGAPSPEPGSPSAGM